MESTRYGRKRPPARKFCATLTVDQLRAISLQATEQEASAAYVLRQIVERWRLKQSGAKARGEIEEAGS